MQFVPCPANRAVRAPVGRIPDTFEKAAFGFGRLLVAFYEGPDCLHHQTAHGLVFRKIAAEGGKTVSAQAHFPSKIVKVIAGADGTEDL
jgi:hypothetical protein